jgi:hypothetical protein
MAAYFEGTIPEFRRYLGTAYFGNKVKQWASGPKSKRLGLCEGIDGIPPHHAEELKATHRRHGSRLAILDKILSKYMISDTRVRCDLEIVVAEFRQAHSPIEKAVIFLCADCTEKYDRGSGVEGKWVLVEEHEPT